MIGDIKKICRKSKYIGLWERDGVQWIGDHASYYPLHGFPHIDKQLVFRLFDIPKDKEEDYTFETGSLPNWIDSRDNGEDIKTQAETYEISYAGRNMIPYITEENIFFMDKKYLGPVPKSEFHIAMREAKKGNYFVIKKGLLLIGVVAQIDVTEIKGKLKLLGTVVGG